MTLRCPKCKKYEVVYVNDLYDLLEILKDLEEDYFCTACNTAFDENQLDLYDEL